MVTRLLVFVFLMGFYFSSIGQSILEEQIHQSHVGMTLPEVLQDLSSPNTKVYYLQEWIEAYQVADQNVGSSLRYLLDELFGNTSLSYIEMYPNLVVIIKDPSARIEHQQKIQSAVSSGYQMESIKVGSRRNVTTDSLCSVTGYVSNWSNGEPLVAVPILVNGGTFLVDSDVSGRFSFQLSPGQYLLTMQYLGFRDKVINLEVYQSGEIEVTMEEEFTQLNEVVIEGKQTVEMSAAEIGKSILDIQSVKKAPALMGTPDIIRQVQSLAGVTSVGEASGGFNVRGGGIDQNLVLLDGIPQFNSSHAIGFLNGFNTDAIQKVTFLKGGISAQYGGRASSILDIVTADGQKDRWRGKLGIGILTSHASANGPIKKDTSSLVVALRSTYSDWLVRSIETDFQNFENSTVGFFDGVAKYHQRLSNNRNLRISSYGSYDQFGLTADTVYQWNNLQLGATYETMIKEKINTDLTFGVSDYGYNVDNRNERTASSLKFNVATVSALADFNFTSKNHTIDFGIQSRLNLFNPGQLSPTNDISNAANISLDKQTVIENAIYLSHSYRSNEKLFITTGLRLPYFINFGPEEINLFEEGSARSIVDIIGTRSIGTAQIAQSYINLEPRLALRYMLGERTAIKAGYNRMTQYTHLISSTTSVTPVDIWKPSDFYLKPQTSDQVSLGLSLDMGKQNIGINAEVFYKNLENVVEFKPGARLILNDNLETELLQGNGRAYGVELSFQKSQGQFTGTANYTYSRSFRTFDNPNPELQINDGSEFPSNFDQPHVANLSWTYNLTRRYIFSGTFSFRKGRPITLPLGAFNLEQTTLAIFSDRNQFRIPDYHRLDLALIIQSNHKRNRKAKSHWALSIYNVYGRKNPYSIFFRTGQAGVPKPFRLAVIGIPLPSISYNLEWN